MAKATSRQIAYLKYLGETSPETFSKSEAGEKIDQLHDLAEQPGYTALKLKTENWWRERVLIYPDLYPEELCRAISADQQAEFRGYVRRRVVGASEKLTQKHIDTVIRTLTKADASWWQSPYANNRFFTGLSEMFPGCVDGRAPEKSRKKVSSKAKKAPRRSLFLKWSLLVLAGIIVLGIFVDPQQDSDTPDSAPVPASTKRTPTPPKKPAKPPTPADTIAPSASRPSSVVPAPPPASTLPIPTDTRKWKSADGRVLLGRVTDIDLESGTITIKRADGPTFENFPLSNLAPEDRALLIGPDPAPD